MAEDRRPQPQPAPDEAEGGEGREAPTATGGSGGATRTQQPPGEVGGPKGPEPTRYGDWEKGGRCIDF